MPHPNRFLLEILTYWFGALSADAPMPDDAIERRRWYGKDEAIDSDIRARFLDGYLDVLADLSRGWQPDNLQDALATIILLDQMPRNMFRGMPGMYGSDPAALALSRYWVRQPDYVRLDLFRAMFVAMPLMHAETLADQTEMVGHFAAMADRAQREGSPNAAFFSMSLDYARRHHEIVARFGRFPHRNAILGRKTTPEEAAFLKEPNSAF